MISELRPLAEIAKDQAIVVDCETTALHPDDGGRICSLSVAWYEGGRWGGKIKSLELPFDQARTDTKWADPQQGLWANDDVNLGPDVWAAFCEWLAGQTAIINQNLKFDVTILRAGVRDWGGVEIRKNCVWDTMIVNRELWPTEPTGLKPTLARLGISVDDKYEQPVKKWIAKHKSAYVKRGYPADWSGYDLVPWDIMELYVQQDTRGTLQLAWEQLQHYKYGLADPEWLDRETAVFELLMDVEPRGLPYHAGNSRKMAREARKRQREIGARLPFRPTSHEAKKFFFGEGYNDKGAECLNLPVRAVTDKGGISLTADVLRDMAEDHVEWAQEWWDWSKLDTAASLWYEGYANRARNGVIRPVFRQLGTRTGRFSNERCNLQAVPSNYRLEFEILEGIKTPRQLVKDAVDEIEGWKLLECDLANAELRVAALFANDERMLELINTGADLHTETAKGLFRVEESDSEWPRFRQLGKRSNFSLLFDVGARTFVESVKKETGIVLSEREGRKIITDWHKLYPAHKRAVRREMERAERRGYVELANGRLKWFTRFEDKHKAHNNRVQGSLGEFAKEWWLGCERILSEIGVYDRCRTDGVNGGLVLMVHDSADTLIPEDLEADYRREMEAWTVELWEEYFPGVPGGCDIEEWK